MNLIGAVVQLCALVVASTPRVPPAYSAVGGGAVSMAVTAYYPLTGTHGDATFWLLVEVPALLALTMLAARRAPFAALVPGLAVSSILLRMVWPGPPSLILAGCAGWSLGAVGAAAAGLYLRSLDGNRHRAVARAVQDQRLALARDLHDFVAHDVSGMLVQAQAARLAPQLPSTPPASTWVCSAWAPGWPRVSAPPCSSRSASPGAVAAGTSSAGCSL